MTVQINGTSGITTPGITTDTSGATTVQTSGVKTLSGILDRVVITTVGGTDTFDAGSVNILVEG